MWSRVYLTKCLRVGGVEGCGALVWRTVTEVGRTLLVDHTPRPEGNTAVWQDAPGALRSRAIVEGRPRAGLEKVMMPHVVSCPVAKRLREEAARPTIPGIDKVKGPLPDNVIPFRRRRSR